MSGALNGNVGLLGKVRDARNRRVVFLSHCLLNENTRYPGGACRPGCISEVVQRCLTENLGIVQMPCPEQRAWGGVLKRRLLSVFGLRERHRVLYGFRRPGLLLFVMYSRLVYQRLARQVASEIQDYVESGFEVAGGGGRGWLPDVRRQHHTLHVPGRGRSGVLA